MADDMPNQYNYEAQTTSTTQSVAIGPDMSYIRTVPAILKIAEIALCLIAFICACINPSWAPIGGGWVQFVCITAFIGILVLFIFHFMHIIARIPGPMMMIEFIYYCVYTLFMLIAAIVAAARGSFASSIGAAAFFCFAALVVLAIDTFMMFRSWQACRLNNGTSGAASTTTTTTTTTREQY